MEQEIPKETYEKPSLTIEGQLKDITAGITVIIKPE
jgi:hypothetical protein